MNRGMFITFEGGEGTGKSTQLRLLEQYLKNRDIPVLSTREPGGSKGAEEIRQLLVTGTPGRWDATTETLLHFAARRDHLVRTVWPALAEGKFVISDRFADSTVAYQGYGHGLGYSYVEDIYSMIVGDFAPDLTIILDMETAKGLQRAESRGGTENRYEQMEISFHERLREGFLDIALRYPNRCVVLPAIGPVEAVHANVVSALNARIDLAPFTEEK